MGDDLSADVFGHVTLVICGVLHPHFTACPSWELSAVVGGSSSHGELAMVLALYCLCSTLGSESVGRGLLSVARWGVRTGLRSGHDWLELFEGLGWKQKI